ncbi:YrrS family protein [Bacillus ndiopicus]|uniref:YrrS family protein n=1 Tax=Bacillus ndiopicus TaxID=1347368 RepID=UPI0005A89995|nr:YrrS family protein [Bacillus ndiopicus]
MEDYEQNKNSRLESRQQRRQQKSTTMNRLLNYLIALVIVLIGITSYIIFFTGDDKATDKGQIEQQADDDVNTNEVSEKDNSINEDSKNESNEAEESSSSGDSQQTTQSPEDSTQENDSTNIVSPSTDPLVEEVIENPNWQPTKTAQTEPHVSVFKDGHIDYEEKLATIFAVTPLTKDNSILWSIKNNGSADSAIAVISSTDKTEKYRVSIVWVANEGWKPVKLEKLSTIEGSW